MTTRIRIGVGHERYRRLDRFHFRWPLTLAYLALIWMLSLLASASGQSQTILLSGAVGFCLLGAAVYLFVIEDIKPLTPREPTA